MFESELSPGAALDQLKLREQNITDSRLAAAQFCVALAMQAENQGLYDGILNHFSLTKTADLNKPRQGGMRQFGFWLRGAQELTFADTVVPAPRAVSVDVCTSPYYRSDDDGISVALHTEPGRKALRIQLGLFNNPSQWWLDSGETGPNIGERFEADGEESMQQYFGGRSEDLAALQATGGVILKALSTATWEETLRVNGGDIF